MQTLPQQDAIAERAYEIWEAEGRPEGRHLEHWRQAEEEFGVDSDSDRAPEAGVRPEAPVSGDADSATPAI